MANSATLAQTQLEYIGLGLCALPADRAGKQPILSWTEFKHRMSTAGDWIRYADAICVMGGQISGSLEMIDFDQQAELFEPWRGMVNDADPDLFAKLVIETSQSGGKHVIYRCPEATIPGNHKLARRPIYVDSGDEVTIAGKKYEPRLVDGRWQVAITLIETRGEGGIFLCAPSPGYTFTQGSFHDIPVVTANERLMLVDAARTLNELFEPAPQPRKPRAVNENGDARTDRPGDDFNERGDVRPYLEKHGWTQARSVGTNEERWRRPGKTLSHSATLKDNRLFYVFSSNASPFAEEQCYLPFQVYTLLEHNGDFSAAASALRKDGYGSQDTKPGKKYDESEYDPRFDDAADAQLLDDVDITGVTGDEGGSSCHNGDERPDIFDMHGDDASTPQKQRPDSGRRDKTAPNKAKKGVSSPKLQWKKFPTEILPGVAGEFVEAASAAIDCDESMVALPVLCTLAGAIGATRNVMLKKSWSEPPVCWGAIVAESGSKKSPAIDAPMKAVMHQEMANIEEFEQSLALYQAAQANYKAELNEWQKKGKRAGEKEPEAPEAPTCKRFVVSDVTPEALADRLKENPRGVLLKNDELSGFLGGMNQYKSGGKGNEEAKWLSIHGARELVIDRKTGARQVTAVRRAAVSIIGGIQPKILKSLCTREFFESGMVARFLMVYPPPRVAKWTENDITEELEERFYSMVNRLKRLEFDVKDDQLVPEYLPLTEGAKKLFIRFHDEHAEEAALLTGDLSAAWSKLIGYAARFALIIELAKWAQTEQFEPPKCIHAESVKAGIELARWCSNETKRIYQVFSETDEERELRETIDAIHRHGGRITPRDLHRSARTKFTTVDEAEMALQELVNAGLGTWEKPVQNPAGGRPSIHFVLKQFRDETPITPENGEVSSGDEPENDHFDEQSRAAAQPQQCTHNYPVGAMNVDGNLVRCPGCGISIGFVDEYPELDSFRKGA